MKTHMDPSMHQDLAELLQKCVNERIASSPYHKIAPELLTGDAAALKLRSLTGGDINQVYCAEHPSGLKVLFKWHPDPPDGFFAAEALGLKTLAKPNAIRIPRVFAHSDRGILMEWLERANPVDEDQLGAALGRALAKLHRNRGESFGFERDNFVGLLPQQNTPTSSWLTFYRDYRIRPQLDIADQRGRLPAQRRRQAERLLDQLGEWIDDNAVKPSLIHGDLWAGNWLSTPEGPALIDPAVYYGDREMDLAMASLFGGFPQSFFWTYDEVYPLLSGYKDRQALYQLYYLLIHLNIFGEGYGPAVDRILARYGS